MYLWSVLANLEGEACAGELNKLQAKVAGVVIVIVGLDVADAAVVILELTLNDKVRVIGSPKIKIIVVGDLAIERDLKVLVAGLPDRNVLGAELEWRASVQCLSFDPNTPTARTPA